MAEETLSISEVGERTGLQSSALRFYEREGLIRPTTRVGGRRHYSPDVLQRLAVISLFQEVGFTIGEIGQLLTRRAARRSWRPLAENKLAEIDEHLDRVNAAKELLNTALACDCEGLETCELVQERRGRHRKVVQTLPLRMGPPA